jgi:hypothetical protein
MGRYANNIGQPVPYPYWTEQYFDIIASHKFMICGENTKMTTYSTEKIANPYIAKTIPIYWGTHNVKNIFNKESMLFLEDETEDALTRLLERIIELDSDDAMYLEFVNRPVFTELNSNYWNEHYTIEALASKIDSVLRDVPLPIINDRVSE